MDGVKELNNEDMIEKKLIKEELSSRILRIVPPKLKSSMTRALSIKDGKGNYVGQGILSKYKQLKTIRKQSTSLDNEEAEPLQMPLTLQSSKSKKFDKII